MTRESRAARSPFDSGRGSDPSEKLLEERPVLSPRKMPSFHTVPQLARAAIKGSEESRASFIGIAFGRRGALARFRDSSCAITRYGSQRGNVCPAT